jgi:cyclophilin family peptidyl-prolyl cis-trans isomerase
MKLRHLPVILILLFSSCQGNKTNLEETPLNIFSNPEMVKLYEFQDRREGDSLLQFFSSEDSLIREKAVLAFGSISNIHLIHHAFYQIYNDSCISVKNAGFYAMGQQRDSTLGHELALAIDKYRDHIDLKIGLTALGKCARQSSASYFANFSPKNSDEEEALSWGMFHAAYNGVLTDEMIERSWEFTQSENTSARLGAAFTLQRAKRKGMLDIDKDGEEIMALLENESNLEVILKYEQILNESINADLPFDSSFIVTYDSVSNPYQRAKLLKLVVDDSDEWFAFLDKVLWGSKEQILVTTAADVYLKANSKRMKMNINSHISVLNKMLKSDDMALQSSAALDVNNIDPSNIDMYKDLVSVLIELKNNLHLPEKTETYYDVLSAIAHLEGKELERPKPEYNHPIDWDFVKTIPSDQKVIISTTKGDIIIQCFVNEAPGSVSNFLKLVDSSYYDGKFFHRVVEDFVIQSGCHRGDGWGSPVWSQRSEFSNYQTYSTGTIGLASAGKDTEGYQWFITHCPTPFLDGRYSIFGRVLDGMEVVAEIEVGDKVQNISRLK